MSGRPNGGGVITAAEASSSPFPLAPDGVDLAVFCYDGNDCMTTLGVGVLGATQSGGGGGVDVGVGGDGGDGEGR